VPNANLTRLSIPLTAYLRYTEINSLIEGDLKPIIEIRNKLAHGQWARTLNNEMSDISQQMMQLLNTENALSANFKKQIVEMLSRIVHDLVTSAVAFDRDFDNHYHTLYQAKTNLQTRSYEDWVAILQENFDRGKSIRDAIAD
jgi:hypothetical protein